MILPALLALISGKLDDTKLNLSASYDKIKSNPSILEGAVIVAVTVTLLPTVTVLELNAITDFPSAALAGKTKIDNVIKSEIVRHKIFFIINPLLFSGLIWI